MKNNMELIAKGNAGQAITAYAEEANLCGWTDNVNEDGIYAELDSPEFKAYMAILGLEEQKCSSAQAA